MKIKWRSVSNKFILLLAIASLILTACTSSKNESGVSNTGTDGIKELKVAWSTDPATLDPHDTRDNFSNTTTFNIYEPLVVFNENMEIVPLLAKSWTVSEDKKKWTFILQEGVTFQDGTPFNAEAAKRSFERVFNKDNKLVRYSLIGPYVDKITADSETQLTFHLKETYAPFLRALANPGSSIISPKAIEENEENLSKNPVGTGPFQLKSWVNGDSMVLEANPSYWGEKPKISQITFKTVPENASRVIMLENGEVDIIYPVSLSEIDRLKENDKVNISSYKTNLFQYIGINTLNEPIKDVKVRQALNYAVNKEELVDKIFRGYGKVATASLGEITWGHSNVGSYPYDKEKAKQLLSEAGIKEGTTLKMLTTSGSTPGDLQTAQFIQNSLQEVGIKVELVQMDLATLLTTLNDPSKYDLVLRSSGPPTNDADWSVRALFSTGIVNNYSNFSNPEADKLIQAGLYESNEEQRRKIYADLFKLIKDQAPWIFLNEFPGEIGMANNIDGVIVYATEIIDFKNVVKK